VQAALIGQARRPRSYESMPSPCDVWLGSVQRVCAGSALHLGILGAA
jgi:hypothetical protein